MSALRGVATMTKNRFGIFSFPHLSRKLKEREWEGDALARHKSGGSVMS